MGTVVLRAGVIFDGHSSELLDGADVLIADGEIKEVSERRLKTASAQEIHLGGRFLMPGLIDAHFHAYAAHVNLASLDDWPMSLLSQHARTLLEDAFPLERMTIQIQCLKIASMRVVAASAPYYGHASAPLFPYYE